MSGRIDRRERGEGDGDEGQRDDLEHGFSLTYGAGGITGYP